MKHVLAFIALMLLAATATHAMGFDLENPTARCGNVLYFDYGSATKGPAYYTGSNGAVLCEAGGFCEGRETECRQCAEKYWRCDIPQPMEAEKR